MRQEEPMDLWVYEREAFDAGIKLVCGVDEAGRGPLCGPVCVAACILDPENPVYGINDSKKLTEKKRCARSTAQPIYGGYIKFSLEPIKAIVFLH